MNSVLFGFFQMKDVIRSGLEPLSTSFSVFIWDGEDENPYEGFLALAEYIIVTADSVNMVSEACSTGKPVYVHGENHCQGKFIAFHRLLRERGCTRPFEGKFEKWAYEPLKDSTDAAKSVLQLLKAP
mmetsp:Transcript_6548/g.10175  ORF Transcript_6548/g.10175 Transcript_6548/m.10175 type:complete len:127 (-) Transcript_6548:259-639(-)